MTKVTSVRTAVQSDNTATGTRDKPKHYINFYRKGSTLQVDQIGYMVLDGTDDYIAACQASEVFVANAFSTELVDAVYRQAGVSSQVPTKQDLSKFM